MKPNHILSLILILWTATGCTLASPFDKLAASALEAEQAEAIKTPRTTFTPTPPHSPTPTKSELSADHETGHTPPGEVVKSGNTNFEPLSGYVSGVWHFHLETADGVQVSDTYPVEMDVNNRVWYFCPLGRIDPESRAIFANQAVFA